MEEFIDLQEIDQYLDLQEQIRKCQRNLTRLKLRIQDYIAIRSRVNTLELKISNEIVAKAEQNTLTSADLEIFLKTLQESEIIKKDLLNKILCFHKLQVLSETIYARLNSQLH